MENLKTVMTSDLVRELERRESVKVENAEPYNDKTITVNGPAKILIITD